LSGTQMGIGSMRTIFTANSGKDSTKWGPWSVEGSLKAEYNRHDWVSRYNPIGLPPRDERSIIPSAFSGAGSIDFNQKRYNNPVASAINRMSSTEHEENRCR
jgi:hypothetical protein